MWATFTNARFLLLRWIRRFQTVTERGRAAGPCSVCQLMVAFYRVQRNDGTAGAARLPCGSCRTPSGCRRSFDTAATAAAITLSSKALLLMLQTDTARITEPGNRRADANIRPVALRDFLLAAIARRPALEGADRERDASTLPHARQGIRPSPRADKPVPGQPGPNLTSFPSFSQGHRHRAPSDRPDPYASSLSAWRAQRPGRVGSALPLQVPSPDMRSRQGESLTRSA